MTLIDTSDNYGEGRSEELIGRVIAGQRDGGYLVSKVSTNMTREGIARACDGTLARLGTDHLDLYLLHWRSSDADLSAVVAAFESLRGKENSRLGRVQLQRQGPGRPLQCSRRPPLRDQSSPLQP